MANPPGFRLYPRGFMGAVPAPTMPPAQANQMLIEHRPFGRIALTSSAPSDICANDEVDKLYAMYVQQSGQVASVAFRDRVLKEAFRSFGSKSFFRWVKQQTLSPGCGDTQYRYLADLLNFLNGQRRAMHQTTWELVVVVDKPCKAPDVFVQAFEEFFDARPEEPAARRNDSLVDVIQAWCSRPNGIEDLLQTLHLLFGNP